MFWYLFVVTEKKLQLKQNKKKNELFKMNFFNKDP